MSQSHLPKINLVFNLPSICAVLNYLLSFILIYYSFLYLKMVFYHFSSSLFRFNTFKEVTIM